MQTAMDFREPRFEGESRETHRQQFTDFQDLHTFLYAGNATITLVSKKTGERFTYKVKGSKPDDKYPNSPVSHFVAVLTGPDNTKDFAYLGCIYRNDRYIYGQKSKIGFSAPSSETWSWFYNVVMATQNLFLHKLEIWHEGRCGMCGRKLTVPESIENGIGPECAKHIGAKTHHG